MPVLTKAEHCSMPSQLPSASTSLSCSRRCCAAGRTPTWAASPEPVLSGETCGVVDRWWSPLRRIGPLRLLCENPPVRPWLHLYRPLLCSGKREPTLPGFDRTQPRRWATLIRTTRPKYSLVHLTP